MSLINREALLSFEKMDADLCATCGEHHTAEDVIMMIKTAPTVDAVPVVRCRECEYAFKSGSSITGIRCEVWGTYDLFHACEPDWFCSHGKRKEGAD